MHKNYINNEWVESAEVYINVSPGDQSDIVGEYAKSDKKMVRDAAFAAADAFKTWRRTNPAKRAEFLDVIGQRIKAEADQIGRILAREEGKTLMEATMEVRRAGAIFSYYARIAEQPDGLAGASLVPGMRAETRRQPLGVVAAICPWNFPAAIPAWKCAPAMAFGNTVILKPALDTPGTAWEFSRIIAECGLPAGVFNLLMGSGGEIGDAITSDRNVAAITFTGSNAVGQNIIRNGVVSGKKVQAELGGKNPLVILADADLSKAVEVAVTGVFMSTGQRCTAYSRIIVDKEIYLPFLDALKKSAKAYKVGYSLDSTTQMGPAARESQLKTDLKYISLGVAEGAKTILKGDRAAVGRKGYYITPTVFSDVTQKMTIWQEEIFGPIACVAPAESFDHALDLVNDNEFGLCAAIMTNSLKYAEAFKEEAQAGVVMVNAPPVVDYQMPFGGIKGSGYGPKEMGAQAVEFFTNHKTSYIGV